MQRVEYVASVLKARYDEVDNIEKRAGGADADMKACLPEIEDGQERSEYLMSYYKYKASLYRKIIETSLEIASLSKVLEDSFMLKGN